MIFIAVVLLFLFSLFFMFFYFQKKSTFFEKKMTDQFKSISFDLMEKNANNFLNIAQMSLDKYQKQVEKEVEKRHEDIKSSLNPVNETLKKMEDINRQIEKQREGAYSSLQKQIDTLITSENNLIKETANLSKALSSPNIRGGWGQIHLKRVVELAGMVNHCDFFEQNTSTYDGKTIRPDLIVKLPGGRQIVIDAKAPIEAYLTSVDVNDEDEKKRKLKEHALSVKKHIKDLSSKEYWKHFSPSPEYVILFLPAEALFSSALQIDPTLLEQGVKSNIILATPTTLIAILRAVAYGWKQESISKRTEEIAKVGKELYDRLNIMINHWHRLGKSLSNSIDSYNQAISSFETRVMVSARKLNELGSVKEDSKSIDSLQEINLTTKSIGLPNLTDLE